MSSNVFTRTKPDTTFRGLYLPLISSQLLTFLLRVERLKFVVPRLRFRKFSGLSKLCVSQLQLSFCPVLLRHTLILSPYSETIDPPSSTICCVEVSRYINSITVLDKTHTPPPRYKGDYSGSSAQTLFCSIPWVVTSHD